MTNEEPEIPADLFRPLNPEEWDFRPIPEDQLEYAVFYEYARNCEWILDRFENWHKTTLSFPGVDPELALWNGMAVGEALEKLQTCEAPLEVHEFIAKSGPEGNDVIPELDLLRQLNQLFPLPFLKSDRIAENILFAKKSMPLSRVAPPFREISGARKHYEYLRRYEKSKSPDGKPHSEFAWDDPEEIASLRKRGIHKFEIVLDLRYSKTRLKKEIGKWIKGLNDKDVRKFPVRKGRATRPAWVHLKRLAAYRLSEIHITHQIAQKGLKAYSNQDSSVRRVWPIYNRSGWSGAKKRVKKLIRTWFPRPKVR